MKSKRAWTILLICTPLCVAVVNCKKVKDERAALQARGQEAPEVGETPSHAPFILILSDSYGISEVDEELGEPPRLVLAVWEDGAVIWSDDRYNGGAPYFRAMLGRDEAEALRREIAEFGIVAKTLETKSFTVPSGAFMEIRMLVDGNQVRLTSCHELYESPDIVAIDSGLVLVEGREVHEIEAERSDDFKRFIELWTTIRQRLELVVPETGERLADLPPYLRP
ncbi:MAG: hypothetical protein JSV78_01720, partial [Phycisphaerales bacterium]